MLNNINLLNVISEVTKSKEFESLFKEVNKVFEQVNNTSSNTPSKEEIKKSGLEYHYELNSIGIEGLFLEWIIKALKVGGKAYIVIPDGTLSRNLDKNLRKYIIDECFIDSIISLPSKTFFTTLKKTYILGITKKHNKSEVQTAPVFSYLVSDIGETLDIYRLEKSENDLNIE